MLDLMGVRASAEAGQVAIRWVPSKRNLADPMTKSMDTEELNRVLREGHWCLLPSDKEKPIKLRIMRLVEVTGA